MNKAINHKKHWTKEDDEKLKSKWGKITLKQISRILHRSQRSIKNRAIKLGLGGMYDVLDHWTGSDIASAIGVARSTTSKWIKEYGLPSHKIKLGKSYRYQVEWDDLMHWLENNQDKWRTDKMEYLALGEEPEWLVAKRQLDKQTELSRKPYTKAEDNKIVSLYKQNYLDREIAAIVGRNENKIRHRIKKLRKENSDIPYKNAKNQLKSRAV